MKPSRINTKNIVRESTKESDRSDSIDNTINSKCDVTVETTVNSKSFYNYNKENKLDGTSRSTIIDPSKVGINAKYNIVNKDSNKEGPTTKLIAGAVTKEHSIEMSSTSSKCVHNCSNTASVLQVRITITRDAILKQ